MPISFSPVKFTGLLTMKTQQTAKNQGMSNVLHSAISLFLLYMEFRYLAAGKCRKRR